MPAGKPDMKTAAAIVEHLKSNGYRSYLAGGCVRDFVMNQKPKDFDIATAATPDEITGLFRRTVPLGARFGVIIIIKDRAQYEVATFRTDHGYSDGRRPDKVCFSSPEEDARRRDFTLNGMFFDPAEKKVIDYVDGQKDIDRRIIRAIGSADERFSEDRLRMLRAVRFSARFNFSIEKNTMEAIRKHRREIRSVSPERLREEITKMLTDPNPGKAFRCLRETGLLQEVLPEVDDMVGVNQPPQYHPEGDVFEHTCLMLDGLKSPSEVLAWSVLLHDVGKPPTYREASDRIRFHNHNRVGAKITERICRRLRFSNDMRDAIFTCVDNHMNFMNVQVMRQSTLKKLLRRLTFRDELALHKLDCQASHGDLSNWAFLTEKASTFKEQEIRPDPVINGEDLIKAGYKPGPVFKEMLSGVENMQLENKIHTRKEAINWIKENYP